jgi:hypothetical protein
VGALNDIEFPLQERMPGLRGLGHIHPCNDLGFKITVAVAALKCLAAIGLSLFGQQIEHGYIITLLFKKQTLKSYPIRGIIARCKNVQYAQFG